MAAITLVQINTDAQPSPSAPSTNQFNLISLPDPANDNDDTHSLRDYILIVSSPSRSQEQNAIMGASQQQSSSLPLLEIHEIQSVLPHSSGKYASYFVGSRIISNPQLHVSTRVDPLFFVLAHFHRIITMRRTEMKSGRRAEEEEEQISLLTKNWQPWDQLLDGLPSPVLRALHLDPNNLNISSIYEVGQLAHILDVSDMCGDDLILCKFSEERSMQWLLAKFLRSVKALRVRLQQQHEMRRREAEKEKVLNSRRQGEGKGLGAYSSSFVVAAEEEEKENGNGFEETKIKETEKGEVIMDSTATLTNEEEHKLKVAGLQLICDYIPTEWRTKLCKEVGLDDMDWMVGEKKKQFSTSSTTSEDSNTTGIGEKKRSRAAWEGTIGQDDADALLHYTQGNGNGKSSTSSIGVAHGKKSSVQEAKSVGLKKLAKVNTRGMKSLSSFFGAGGKTKKTT
jgi:hypothetical protein